MFIWIAVTVVALPLHHKLIINPSSFALGVLHNESLAALTLVRWASA